MLGCNDHKYKTTNYTDDHWTLWPCSFYRINEIRANWGRNGENCCLIKKKSNILRFIIAKLDSIDVNLKIWRSFDLNWGFLIYCQIMLTRIQDHIYSFTQANSHRTTVETLNTLLNQVKFSSFIRNNCPPLKCLSLTEMLPRKLSNHLKPPCLPFLEI